MRISDWSSDVCSSDLNLFPNRIVVEDAPRRPAGLVGERIVAVVVIAPAIERDHAGNADEIQRDRVEQIVGRHRRSEEHTSELQSLMRISYAVFCLKKKK